MCSFPWALCLQEPEHQEDRGRREWWGGLGGKRQPWPPAAQWRKEEEVARRVRWRASASLPGWALIKPQPELHCPVNTVRVLQPSTERETKHRPSHLGDGRGGYWIIIWITIAIFPLYRSSPQQRASQPPSWKIIIIIKKKAVSGFLGKYARHGGLCASINCMELHFLFCVRDHIYAYVHIGMCASFIIPPRLSFFICWSLVCSLLTRRSRWAITEGKWFKTALECHMNTHWSADRRWVCAMLPCTRPQLSDISISVFFALDDTLIPAVLRCPHLVGDVQGFTPVSLVRFGSSHLTLNLFPTQHGVLMRFPRGALSPVSDKGTCCPTTVLQHAGETSQRALWNTPRTANC